MHQVGSCGRAATVAVMIVVATSAMADVNVNNSVGGSHNNGGFTSVVGVSSFGNNDSIVSFDSIDSVFGSFDVGGFESTTISSSKAPTTSWA